MSSLLGGDLNFLSVLVSFSVSDVCILFALNFVHSFLGTQTNSFWMKNE